MRVTLGVICVLFGLLGWAGQLISAIHFPLAQRLGLQEQNEGTDGLFRTCERNTAMWDVFVLWTLPVASILMLMDQHWWPAVSLIAGAIHLDTAGREAMKLLSLRSAGVRTGLAKELRISAGLFLVMAIIALVVMSYALWALGTRMAMPAG